MAVDQKLMAFVVRLVVDDAFRARFDQKANREDMMREANLSEAAKTAIRDTDPTAVTALLNTQVVTAEPE